MLKVNDAIISQPIHAKLNCDKAAATAKQEADTQVTASCQHGSQPCIAQSQPD